MSDDDCIADFKLRCRQRTAYPGASAFDFAAILNIVISDILGWDPERGCSTDEGGAFGKIDAFSGAVEEQGRKTLHVHMLLYIKELSKLLEGLQATSPTTDRTRHNALKRALKKYVSAVMSTRLHPPPSDCIISFKHDCSTRKCTRPQAVSHDVLRMNRHKRGCIIAAGSVTVCPKCDLTHSSEMHLLKRIQAICPEITSFPDDTHRLDILIMRHLYYYRDSMSQKDRDDSDFLINAFFNHHSTRHAKSCFKYGIECRYNLPTLPRKTSIVNVHEGAKLWINLMGERLVHHPISVDLQREITDVFMNTYNVPTTSALGSNTNVNTGEIRTVFYCTTYTSKNTQEDDKESFQRVINAFIRRTAKKRRELEEADLSGNAE